LPEAFVSFAKGAAKKRLQQLIVFALGAVEEHLLFEKSAAIPIRRVQMGAIK
jgi:hypothetical protein